MGIHVETAKKAERIARRMARKVYGSDDLWEVFLAEAYYELFPYPAPPGETP